MSAPFVAAAIARLDGSEADGIHLLWTAPPAAGYSIDGWDIRRRDARGRPKVSCYQLFAGELETLHRVLRLHTPVADVAVRQAACPEFPKAGGSGGVAPVAVPHPSLGGPLAIGTSTGARGCGAYDISLPEGHRVVEVHAGVPGALAIALRRSKAVAARALTAPGSTQSTRFENLDVDEVLLYTGARATSLEICLDAAPNPDEEDQEWAGEKLIAKGIQVPVRALDPALASQADEDALAKSRLLAGEDFDEDAFHDVAELMNAAAADTANAAPVWATTVTREEPDDPFIDVRSWSYALALLVDPVWRRMLGFGFLDGKGELTPGAAYDYRITGRFRRRDIEERLHGFHTVPRGATLPSAFALGPAALRTPAPATVEQLPEPPADSSSATGRKGIRLEGERCLKLSFPAPVTSVVLELAEGSDLSWTATTTDFLPSLPFANFGGPLPSQRRVRIETADPVDTITLSGFGFLFGLREGSSPAESSPEDVLTRSVVLHGVVFQDTLLLDPPLSLGTQNLQQPTLPGDPADAEPPAALGFRLTWLPPPPAGSGGPLPWPPDVGAFPPFDALGFRLERRRADTGGAFELLDGTGPETVVFSSRSGGSEPPALGPGVDLEAAFPEEAPPVPPVSPFMTLDDALATADHEGPPPGSTHQYRIFSVDGIGRPSATAREGPVVRLEKRQAPPKPVGPPAGLANGAIAPSGVRARVLQALDPDLPPGDIALLGASENAIVLEWGWTQAERDHDPDATEFRIYWQPTAPDVVSGEVTGPPTAVGTLFEMPATLDRPVAADALQGRYLKLPEYPFKVASNTAGESIVLRVERSVLDSARIPGPAAFEFRPVLNGSEQRPPAWAERTAVVPITAEESYRHVFRDRLSLDAGGPRARVSTGVSSADDQGYVDDTLPAGELNGGRPGNESAIVAGVAAARYLGRPELTVPPPLPDVPEQVTGEPGGDTVAVVLDLPALLPAVPIPPGHRIQLDRIGLDVVASSMGANPDGTIGADLPGGVTTTYTLGNPGDQAALLAQIRTGLPARVEGRFLMDFLLRFGPQLEPLWQPALPDPVDMGEVTDTLDFKAERYVHRIRLVDAAGHRSQGAAVAPQIVRVPSLRSPGPPKLSAPSSSTDTLSLEARVRDAFDLAHVVVFSTTTDSALTPNGNLRGAAQLLRLPSRRDLYPNDGIRVRLADGTLLAPALVLDTSAGTADPPDRILTATLTAGHGLRVALWCVALTRDGVPSRLTGPIVALTGRESS